MINFFRKLRQKEITNNKFSSYLLYAIGEIFLVVVGILIALQVNNWNEDRKNAKKEQLILVQLEKEYKSNLAQLEEKMLMRNDIIHTSEDVLDIIDNPANVNKDTLFNKIGILTLDPTFDPIMNDLISSGNLQLIQNKELKNKLSNWTSDVQALQEMEKEWQKMTLQINFPFIVSLNIYRDVAHNQYKDKKLPVYIIDRNLKDKLDIGKSKKTPNIESVLNNDEIESIFARAITSNYVTNLQSHALKNKINELLTLLHKEIK
jgi:hypothetical protein